MIYVGEVQIDTQLYEFVDRPGRAREALLPLLKAFVLLGNMPVYQIKQMLEGLAQEWAKIDGGDAPLLTTQEDPDGNEEGSEEGSADAADGEPGEGVREG